MPESETPNQISNSKGDALFASRWVYTAHRWLVATFVVTFALAWLWWIQIWLSTSSEHIIFRWPGTLFLCVAAACTLIGLARRLPSQNVIALAVQVGIFSTGVSLFLKCFAGQTLIQSLTGIPPEPLIQLLSGSQPLRSSVALLCSLDVAQLILHPRRGSGNFGLHLILLTAILTSILDFGVEPLDILLWGRCELNITVLLKSLILFIASLTILVVTTPWRINKQPAEPPLNPSALIVWLLLDVYYTTANALLDSWFAVLPGAVAGLFMLRLIRRERSPALSKTVQ